MKTKIILALLFVFVCLLANCQESKSQSKSENIKKNSDGTYEVIYSKKDTTKIPDPVVTTIKDKGIIYPVYRSKKGFLYYIKKSKKGNFYRKYF